MTPAPLPGEVAPPGPRWAAAPSGLTRPPAVAALCLLAAAAIGVLDLVSNARHWPVPVIGLLDEPAHLMTTGLLVAAFWPWRLRSCVPWILAGSVLIDVDHIPLYLWGALVIDGAGRPVTHSLLTVLVLAVLGAVSRGRLRTALLGLSLGVLAHFVRDLGTDPGVLLFWPVGTRSVLVPYAAYYGVVLAVTAVAVLRQLRRSRRPGARATGSAGSTVPPGPA